jgi:hypothetical protein
MGEDSQRLAGCPHKKIDLPLNILLAEIYRMSAEVVILNVNGPVFGEP